MCDRGCNSCGDSFSGLNGLLGALLPAGSTVTVTLDVSVDWSLFGGGSLTTEINNEVEGCIWNSGGFNAVQASFNGSYTSNNASLTVTVQTYNDHGDINDVGAWVQGIIQDCVPELNVHSYSVSSLNVQVDSGSPVVAPSSNGKCPAGYYDDSYFWQPTHCVLASAAADPNKPVCPPGYYNNGWFSVNCVPVGTEGISKSTWVLIGAAAIGGLILVSKAR